MPIDPLGRTSAGPRMLQRGIGIRILADPIRIDSTNRCGGTVGGGDGGTVRSDRPTLRSRACSACPSRWPPRRGRRVGRAGFHLTRPGSRRHQHPVTAPSAGREWMGTPDLRAQSCACLKRYSAEARSICSVFVRSGSGGTLRIHRWACQLLHCRRRTSFCREWERAPCGGERWLDPRSGRDHFDPHGVAWRRPSISCVLRCACSPTCRMTCGKVTKFGPGIEW